MTVIATNTVRPHLGKAKLQLNNMLEVTKAFGDMGITARVSRVVFGQNAGCLVFSTFAANFTEAMANVQKVFSSEMWSKVQMRLDDNPASDIVMPLNLVRKACLIQSTPISATKIITPASAKALKLSRYTCERVRSV